LDLLMRGLRCSLRLPVLGLRLPGLGQRLAVLGLLSLANRTFLVRNSRWLVRLVLGRGHIHAAILHLGLALGRFGLSGGLAVVRVTPPGAR